MDKRGNPDCPECGGSGCPDCIEDEELLTEDDEPRQTE